ncbi:MAG: tRNA pseudouridine(38-40) synthase TruA [Sulfurovum sp.]|nr:tRNA pseudouridine(38-40) synthase TruA [Sulfurovum sp.]
MRIKAVIAYNGNKFKGFQKQSSTGKTVAGTLEKALVSLGIECQITSSGRTDAGVHATGQVIHFDIPDFWDDLSKLKNHLNGKLDGIYIKYISKVNNNFHARFSAKRRTYRYIFKSTTPSIFEEDFISHIPIQNISKLEEALQCFVGEHDFGYFLKTGSNTKNSVRHIYRTYYICRGDYHFIYFEANGFLRAQVRMMIDFAVRIANYELAIAQLQEQLTLKVTHNQRLASPQGLYLSRVIY